MYFLSSPLIFVLPFWWKNGEEGRLKVSFSYAHVLSLKKKIFVQEGKNRTLMQSCNHVAVRNVIIHFFLVGRPWINVKKAGAHQQICIPRIVQNNGRKREY